MHEKKRQHYAFLEEETSEFGLEQSDEITQEGKVAEQATKTEGRSWINVLEAGKSTASALAQRVEDESGLGPTVKSLCVLLRSGIFFL